MSRKLLVLGGAFVVISSTLSLTAQQEHPNRGTGERPETLYASSAQDSINLFNGNLTYRIPIGEPVPVGPQLRMHAELVYNSYPFTRWEVGCNPPPGTTQTEDYPAGDRIYGNGWQLHFGRLVPVDESMPNARVGSCGLPPLVNDPQAGMLTMWSTGWGYQDPDGTVHAFYDRQTEKTCDVTQTSCENPTVNPVRCWSGRTTGQNCWVHTHDGSFIRMDPHHPAFPDPAHPLDPNSNFPVVTFPDGTYRVMAFRGGRRPASFDVSRQDLPYSHHPADVGPQSHLGQYCNTTLISDRLGNQIVVQYYGDGASGSPAHPLAAQGVPENLWDVIPYKVYSAAFPSVSYTFDAVPEQYTPIDSLPSVWRARVTTIHAPTAAGGYSSADYSLTNGSASFTIPSGPSNATHNVPTLTQLALPALTGQAAMSYLFTYTPTNADDRGNLLSVTLPSGGRYEYDWVGVRLPTLQRSFTCYGDAGCVLVPGYYWDGVRGVGTRRTIRALRTAAGGATSEQTGSTEYVRTYLVEDACSSTTPLNCEERVDQWDPVTDSQSPSDPYVEKRHVTRTTFYGSDGVIGNPIYGRPYQIDEFSVPTNSTVGRLAIDNLTPFRRTAVTYEYDNQSISNLLETNHNAREIKRTVSWSSPSRSFQVSHYMSDDATSSWDSFGHFGTTATKEDTGSGYVTLRRIDEAHLNNTTNNWLLDPVTSRTTSRPGAIGDPSGAQLWTKETYAIDSATGFVNSRTVTSDGANDPTTPDGRTLTTTWTKGTDTSAPCIYGGASYTACRNVGFPKTETVQLTGSRTFGATAEPSDTRTYTRNFFYKNNVLAAAYDTGTTFYVLDRDVSASGKITGERGTEGRTSLTDSTPAFTTTYGYDLLGRLISRQPPDETPETFAYASQSVSRTKACPTDNSDPTYCPTGGKAAYEKTFFDGLARPIVNLRSMPGSNNYSHAITTYDAGGRQVATTEWQAITCPDVDPCTTSSVDLNDLQASIDASHVSTPAGTVNWAIDPLGRPQNTRLADGSQVTNSYTGWWSQTTTRGVNTKSPNVAYTYKRDVLGRLTSVSEPETKQSLIDHTMNPVEDTNYWYDAFDRLIKASKAGSDSAGANTITQTRVRQYDRFGWLVSEQTPEVPNLDMRIRDGRGNATKEWNGADFLLHSYDSGGRLLSSARQGEPNNGFSFGTGYFPNAYENFTYETVGAGLNFGRSNGRLVFEARLNHIFPSAASQWGPPNDLGWFGAWEYSHYNGLGARLSFRQEQTLFLDGVPQPGQSRFHLDAAAAAADKHGLRHYFAVTGRKFSNLTATFASAAAADPNPYPSTASGHHSSGRNALNASYPNGLLHWKYEYDYAGRMKKLTYPRRDEGDATATTVVNSYDKGWLAIVDAEFRSPFTTGNFDGAAYASLTYNPSGTIFETSVRRGAGLPEVLYLNTPDDNGMPRPSAFRFYRGSTRTATEVTDYSYDGSPNVTGAYGNTYSYDARSRLETESLSGGPRWDRYFDGFGNLTNVYQNGVGYKTFVPDRTTNRTSQSGYSFQYDAARGRMLYDSALLMQHDYYPDGRILGEYQHTGDHVQLSSGLSLWLMGSSGERVMTYWGQTGAPGQPGYCSSELYRNTPRDESGRVLTDYKAEHDGYCDCTQQYACNWIDRYQKDTVWLGKWAMASDQRGTGLSYWALDHLGTPRREVDALGRSLGSGIVDAFGGDVNVNEGAPERHRFTGHERDHVSGDDGSSLPMGDYMHARGYSPQLGRFFSPDPSRDFHLFNPQSLNAYAYALDSPARYSDPLGLRAKDEGEDNPGEADDPCADESSDECKIARAGAVTASETATSEPISPALAAVILGTQMAAPVVETTGKLTIGFVWLAGPGILASYYVAPTAFGLGTTGGLLRFGSTTLRFSDHAVQRMLARGLSPDKLLDAAKVSKPFQYFHNGVWKTGYYDPASRVFIGEVGGRITTVLTKVSSSYIRNLQAVVP